ncbi:MAG: hypothetical protein LAT61_10505 [Alcanivorax sp.]|nr:hypothetical protein [Alcanivorax sp.]
MRFVALFLLAIVSSPLHALVTIGTKVTSVEVLFDTGMAVVTLGVDASLASYPYTDECSQGDNIHRVIFSFSLDDFQPGWQAVYATALSAISQDVYAAVTIGECELNAQGNYSRKFQGIRISSGAN